jgi:hypothetical protein
MTRRRLVLIAVPLFLIIVAGVCVTLAQRPRFGRMQDFGDDRRGVPDWKVDPRFKSDVFTFVRVEYDSGGGRGYSGRRGGRGGFGGYYGGWGGGWATDFPDSDLNFSFRLQQLTALKVAPMPIHRRLTDPDLFDYPFLYMIEPGALSYSDEEAATLRRYLLNGGFMMVDDFWGDAQWQNFEAEMEKVFPDRKWVELDLSHEIFHNVYNLKELPQMPSIHSYGWRQGINYEQHHGGGCEQVHYRAFYDDKDRMCVIICHNTDLGDGWEREGEDPDYFKMFSEKKAYPMGINIVTYAMTH